MPSLDNAAAQAITSSTAQVFEQVTNVEVENPEEEGSDDEQLDAGSGGIMFQHEGQWYEVIESRVTVQRILPP